MEIDINFVLGIWIFVLDETVTNQCPMTAHLCPGRAVTYAFWAKVNEKFQKLKF